MNDDIACAIYSLPSLAGINYGQLALWHLDLLPSEVSIEIDRLRLLDTTFAEATESTQSIVTKLMQLPLSNWDHECNSEQSRIVSRVLSSWIAESIGYWLSPLTTYALEGLNSASPVVASQSLAHLASFLYAAAHYRKSNDFYHLGRFRFTLRGPEAHYLLSADPLVTAALTLFTADLAGSFTIRILLQGSVSSLHGEYIVLSLKVGPMKFQLGSAEIRSSEVTFVVDDTLVIELLSDEVEFFDESLSVELERGMVDSKVEHLIEVDGKSIYRVSSMMLAECVAVESGSLSVIVSAPNTSAASKLYNILLPYGPFVHQVIGTFSAEQRSEQQEIICTLPEVSQVGQYHGPLFISQV